MPQKINVSLAKGADEKHYEDAKKQIESQGGKILNEFKLIKGFTAEIPDSDKLSTLKFDENISVENDGEVTTQ